MIKNIGRNIKNDIVINDPKISNFHAQIIIDESGKIEQIIEKVKTKEHSSQILNQ